MDPEVFDNINDLFDLFRLNVFKLFCLFQPDLDKGKRDFSLSDVCSVKAVNAIDSENSFLKLVNFEGLSLRVEI